MKKQIKFKDVHRSSGIERDVEFPNVCPICNKGIQAISISSWCIKNKFTNPNCFILFLCPCCENLFLGQYFAPENTFVNICKNTGYLPNKECEKKVFSKNIHNVSEKFCEIYNQSYFAQQKNLYEICGMGYRKALEFLIKDYSAHIHPDKRDKIFAMNLSQCINDYIDNPKIKNLAKFSTWLGNDETHCIKKLEVYDIDDMINFIDATVAFIDFDLQSIEAEKKVKEHYSKSN